MVEKLGHMSPSRISELVEEYPWFASARIELLDRMSRNGTISQSASAQAAMYVGSGRIVYEIARKGDEIDCSDAEIESMLKRSVDSGRKIYVVGGDYFSQEQYNNAGRDGQNFTLRPYNEDFEIPDADMEGSGKDKLDENVLTETLARIYASQGYPEEAKAIYSKLILRYPEKSVYFASLIEQLDKKL